MAMRSFLFAALGVTAAASLLGSPSNAQTPAAVPAVATNPIAMTASSQCSAVRDLVIDSVVHQMVVGYGYNPYGYGGYYRGGMAVDEAKPSMAKSAEPSAAPTANR